MSGDWPDDDRWDGDDLADALERDVPPHGDAAESRRAGTAPPRRRRRPPSDPTRPPAGEPPRRST